MQGHYLNKLSSISSTSRSPTYNSTIFPLELVAFLSYDFDSRELIKVPIGALEDLAFLYVGGTTIWFSSDYVFHIYDDSLSFHLNCI